MGNLRARTAKPCLLMTSKRHIGTKTMIKIMKRCAAVAILLTVTSHHAAANPDPKEVTAALIAKLASIGFGLTVASSEANGQNIVLKEVVFSAGRGGAETKTRPFDQVTLENVTAKDDGYLVGQVGFPAGTYPVKDGAWISGGGAIKNLKLSPSDKNPWLNFGSIEIQPATFKTDAGKDAFKIGAAIMKVSEKDTLTTMDMAPVTFTVDTAAMDQIEANGQQTAQQLGMTEFGGSIALGGTWDRKDGRTINTMTADLTNAGKMTFSSDMSGYTLESMTAMQSALENLEPDGQKADPIVFLGLLQNITLNGMSMRFDDASVTGKVIDQAAEQAGQPREAFVAQLKATATLMAMASQDAAFVESVSKAVTAFLDNPKNFEVRMAPEKPIPFPMLIAVGMTAGASDPSAIIKLLNMQVVANQ